jgi:predicted phage-related endonuclease
MKVKDALLPQYDVQYGEFDVSIDRDKYIGGSDIPVICGISKFKTRWQLLLEKAGLEQSNFSGNKYTEYGHIIEPQIREYVNNTFGYDFVPNRVINGDLRCHTDGFDGDRKTVLEVKSTSDIHPYVDDYKVYLVQLVKYMEENDAENGVLAVYHRPEDMNTAFNYERLQVFFIKLETYQGLLEWVNAEINRFRQDLERLKENPLLSEHDFLPQSTDLVALANKVAQFESQLAAMKKIEDQLKDAKKELYEQMVKNDVKSWTMPNGTKLTRVDEIPSSTKEVTELDEEAFKTAYPLIHAHYCVTKVKKVSGKAGYVRITVK